MEVYIQVPVQVLLLLLSQTDTPTTGGLTTIFEQKLLGLSPTKVMAASISWSIISCIRLHTKLIALEKGFCKMTSKIFIFIWGTFANLRRVLALMTLFIPSLGLFSILHHWKWEQLPNRVRLAYAERGFMTPEDKISLYGLNETIYWTQYDRWDYSGEAPSPPPYSIYTLMTLRETFTAGAVLLIVHLLLILLVKVLTSEKFRGKGDIVNKIIHLIENIQYASPYEDWDRGRHNIEEFRRRFRATKIEMAATFCVNILVTGVMTIPLLYTGEPKILNICVQSIG